jgi:hypothetical protein
VDFIPQLVRRDKQGHFMLTKGAKHQKEIKITNLYVPNVGSPNFMKHKLMDLKSQVNPKAVVDKDFNTPLSPKDRSSRQKINKEILDLNDTIDLM